jgi:AbrB family looped-hinge helix DNA binding protein
MDLRTTIDSHGRMLIPSSIRKLLDYRTGDTIIIRAINKELHALKLEQVVAEAQAIISQYVEADKSMLEEFLQMRREEFAKEEASKLEEKQ